MNVAYVYLGQVKHPKPEEASLPPGYGKPSRRVILSLLLNNQFKF
jgi:hypothetical protein